ncbi:MAG TPA: cell envelope biogenesis protein OmpA [Rhodobacteraceae bacterium]|jgi:phosphate transport system substrate-binding protein|nr:cell envelope biogenesis protein OmpA [Paracoccaceae bacterium]
MLKICAASFAALFLFCSGNFAAAQDITLTSRDGSVEISGTLLGYDGEFFRVETIYGELTVDGSGVNCEGPGCPSLEDFVAEFSLSGASVMGEILVPALIQGFALREGLHLFTRMVDPDRTIFVLSTRDKAKELARISLRSSNSDEGFADLLAGEADIVMSLREVRDHEVQLAREAGLGDLRARGRVRVLALDALAPIVSQENPVGEVATPQLAQILAGEITSWQELGGPDAPITIHLREQGAGLAQAVVDRILTPIGGALPADVVRHATDVGLAAAVEDDPFGIGVTSAAIVGDAKTISLTGACGFTLTAERNSVKTEDYPLSAPLFLYLPERRLPKLGRDFLAYLRSAPAQLVVRRAGFTDQSPEEIPINAQGSRFANAIAAAGAEVPLSELQRMIGTFSGMKRLSTTFRFEVGSARLDAQSRSHVEQLARAVETGAYDTRQLVFVGFSDGEGPATANREIAQRRAEAVMEAMRSAAETANFDRVRITAEAFGEALPMACDDSAWGRQVNRRVEVWVR